MEKLKFEFDRELAAQRQANHESSARDAATAEYHRTTEWMLRVAARLLLKIGVAFALVVLLASLFLG
jgi:preprotein translocase subunit Sec61beta